MPYHSGSASGIVCRLVNSRVPRHSQAILCQERTPAHVYSDNGTNFQGAQREIKELQQLHLSPETRNSISHYCTSSSIEWHFIPPRAPHFGGLWEAGVRSMKTLLQKLITPHHLRFDELYTILTEFEAVLNSRPIVPLNSTNIDDTTLTLGHFLIGRPLKSPPSVEVEKTKISSLRRWALVNRLSQDLWKAWIGCYLQSLHHRSKWTNKNENVKKDDIVFIKDEVLRYRDWPIACVIEIFPGDDGKVRAADVLCDGKLFRRAIHRLLPLHNDESVKKTPLHSEPLEDVQDSTSKKTPLHSESPEDVQDSISKKMPLHSEPPEDVQDSTSPQQNTGSHTP